MDIISSVPELLGSVYHDFQQELSTTSSKAKNTKGEVITKFSNEPTNLSNYGGKTSYYEMYPKRKPQITDESEEGN